MKHFPTVLKIEFHIYCRYAVFRSLDGEEMIKDILWDVNQERQVVFIPSIPITILV